MRAVSDTSPISNLAIIGRLPLLRSQFDEVWIPAAVFSELQAHPDAASLKEIQEAVRDGWIKAITIAPSSLLNVLMRHLHRGEAEAITLAAEIGAEVVLIDEQEGRQYAVQAGLAVTGVLGILLLAKKNGQIPSLKPEIRALRARAGFFIAPTLEAKILGSAGE